MSNTCFDLVIADLKWRLRLCRRLSDIWESGIKPNCTRTGNAHRWPIRFVLPKLVTRTSPSLHARQRSRVFAPHTVGNWIQYSSPESSLTFPLPPLAEQHRIVAKVDELMALCDRLEAQLTTTQTESRRLLEAVLPRCRFRLNSNSGVSLWLT